MDTFANACAVFAKIDDMEKELREANMLTDVPIEYLCEIGEKPVNLYMLGAYAQIQGMVDDDQQTVKPVNCMMVRIIDVPKMTNIRLENNLVSVQEVNTKSFDVFGLIMQVGMMNLKNCGMPYEDVLVGLFITIALYCPQHVFKIRSHVHIETLHVERIGGEFASIEHLQTLKALAADRPASYSILFDMRKCSVKKMRNISDKYMAITTVGLKNEPNTLSMFYSDMSSFISAREVG